MSLRAFHLLFIALSVALAGFVAAWAAGQYRVAHDLTYAGAGIASIASAAGLAVYGRMFLRKTRGF
jgi:hypothetical protein